MSMTEKAQQYSGIITMAAASVIAGAILAGASALWQINAAMTQVQADMVWIKREMKGVYPASQAKKEHQRIFQTDQDQYDLIEKNRSRIGGLDDRVRDLERE